MIAVPEPRHPGPTAPVDDPVLQYDIHNHPLTSRPASVHSLACLDKQQARHQIIEVKGVFRLGVARVQRSRDRTQRRHGQHQLNKFRAVRQHDGYAVAMSHRQARQDGGQLVHRTGELGMGNDGPVVGTDQGGSGAAFPQDRKQ